ncbi:MAG: hypothetical protein E7247_05755 [Paenibacillaceae bacterium]|nr:hypothetical protein [Paenibacillaceae bacterium]
MQTTPNLGLNKPESNEYVNVTDINENADIIDEAVAAKVQSSGGDISETVIEILDTVEDKYPIPDAGESVKRFFGKMLTFLRNIRPLTGDINIYVSTTGSDTTGDGSKLNPYASIGKALSVVPKNLNGFTASIYVSDGTYAEDVSINGIKNGLLILRRDGVEELNSLCNINKITVSNSDSIHILGFNLIAEYTDSIYATNCEFVYVNCCQSISISFDNQSFSFLYVSIARITGCRSLNHNSCLWCYSSHIYSGNWSDDSIGIKYGTYVDGGGSIAIGNVYQPNGHTSKEYYAAGGIISNVFGAKVGSLKSDTTLYVSTAGSNTTGDGTAAKPFKTIQYAIDTLPKDFGGYFATITISSGTYVEDILISGFSGTLQLTLLGNVTTGSITIGNSRVTCAASIACTLSIKYLYVTASGRFDSFSAVGIKTTGYIDGQPQNGSKASIAANRGDIYISGSITLTGNTDVGMSVISISRVHFSTVTGTGFNIGVVVSTGSVATCGTASGMLISATTPIQQGASGQYVYSNGTQISDDITTGLSCTWGTIRSGYVRHGNLNGAAMISLNMRIEPKVALAAGNEYIISGLPPSNIPGYNTVPVCTDSPSSTSACWLYAGGSIAFRPSVSIPLGTWNIAMSATYKTNS